MPLRLDSLQIQASINHAETKLSANTGAPFDSGDFFEWGATVFFITWFLRCHQVPGNRRQRLAAEKMVRRKEPGRVWGMARIPAQK
jgi:hypothetical protein